MLQNLSPQQKQLLTIGAPVVAVFALVTVLGKRSSSGAATAVTGQLPVMGSGDAVNTGQLGDFESAVNAEVIAATNQLAAATDAANQQLAASQGAQLAAFTNQQQDTVGSLNGQISSLTAQIAALANKPTPAAPAPAPAAAAAPAPASAPPAPAPVAPGNAVIVPNPIQGDNSVVVHGTTSDGYAYTYGGSATQAAMLTDTPAPAPPPQVMPAADGIGRQYVDSDGFTFTYG